MNGTLRRWCTLPASRCCLFGVSVEPKVARTLEVTGLEHILGSRISEGLV